MKVLFFAARILRFKILWFILYFLSSILVFVRKHPKNQIFVGYLAEKVGLKRSAARYYGKAVNICCKTETTEILRWLHTAEFFHERSLSKLGKGRVEDPLFSCTIEPEGHSTSSLNGLYRAEFIFSGLQILGIAASSSVKSVSIFLDDKKIRELKVSPSRIGGKFSFRMTRFSLKIFPIHSTLTVKTDSGEVLTTLEGPVGLKLNIPHGYSENSPLLTGEKGLDKKGTIESSEEELEEKRRKYIDIYNDARVFFKERFGKDLFLIYGTLLGFIRQNDFIPGDDDFDTGFMAESTDSVSVKIETLSMISDLLQAGFSVGFNRRGRLFRLYGRGQGVKGPHLDIHSFWEEEGKIWGHNDYCSARKKKDFIPAVERNFGKLTAFIPSVPEVFLESHYGPGWKVPDPSFINYYIDKDRKVLDNLARALISPGEYRDQIALLEKKEGTGEFVSLGARSLYPLPNQEEDFE
jgi:hypothetical protein